MGCWNETCMVSNLPISNGDRIVAIPIIESGNEKAKGIYATDYWAPFLPFVRGRYDDYGSIESAADEAFEKIAKEFLLKDEAIYDMTGPDFINEFVNQVSRNECDFKFPQVTYVKFAQRVRIAFVHESIFDKMIRKSTAAKIAWDFILSDKTFSLAWRCADGIYYHQGVFYPTGRRKMIPDLLEMGEEKRIEEMVKFTGALDELRMCYHPATGSGSQESVTSFMLEMKEKIAELAKEIVNKE